MPQSRGSGGVGAAQELGALGLGFASGKRGSANACLAE